MRAFLRALIFVVRLVPVALAIALAGCQTTGPAAQSTTLSNRPPPQAVPTRDASAATRTVIMGVGY